MAQEPESVGGSFVPPPKEDGPSIGLGILGCLCFPLGFVLYLVMKGSSPRKAGSAAKGALVGFVFALLIGFALYKIFVAARTVVEEVVKVTNAASMNAASGKGTPTDRMHSAVFAGDIPKVKELLQSDPTLATAKDFIGDTPLADTVLQNRVEIAKLLMDYGADPNAKNNTGQSPMEKAEFFGKTELLNVFRTYKAKRPPNAGAPPPAGTAAPPPGGAAPPPPPPAGAAPPDAHAPLPGAAKAPAVDPAQLKALWKAGADAKHRGDIPAARKAWEEGAKLDPNNQGFQDALKQLAK